VRRMRKRPPSLVDGRERWFDQRLLAREGARGLLIRGDADGERVVEFVRHPTDENAQRFELFDHHELFLHAAHARDAALNRSMRRKVAMLI